MAFSTFAPGWRFSRLDGLVLLATVIAAVVLGRFQWWMGFAIAFTVAHFFLFCNVFRVSRPLELVWAVVFVGLSAATILFEIPAWWLTIVLSLVATVLVVALEMRRPSYHGAGWRLVNPRLPDWWKAHAIQHLARDSVSSS